MSQILIVVGVIWVIVTLLGHLSWVIVAALLRGIFGSSGAATLPPETRRDGAAAHRVVSRMAEANLITPAEARRLRVKIDEVGQPSDRRSVSTTSAPEFEPGDAARRTLHAGREFSASDVWRRTTPAGMEADAGQDLAVQREAAPAQSDLAAAAPTSSPAALPNSMQHQGTEASKNAREAAVANAGKSLAEFLADHNIRWGELIAGMLIVVCSIGLVVSLWTTITEMHRVIPSLIFLGGNAAVFGAGLYTLFRWRLQDTSRATLVIAILLVPLGILAGLSTGGIDSGSVPLNDPVTPASIVAVGAVYAFLIWQASCALVGVNKAIPMTLGVAGPAAVLPFVPASIRLLGNSAGFIGIAGAAAVAIAVGWLLSLSPKRFEKQLPRRLLILGVSAFSLAALGGYLALMLRGADNGWLATAIGILPGGVLLAAGIGSVSASRRRPTAAVAATALESIGLLAAGCLLIPAMQSAGWLWAWATALSVSAGFAAAVGRRPLWIVLTGLPLGLAVVFSSSMVAPNVSWDDVSALRRIIGGEPMLALAAVGIVHMMVAWKIRTDDLNRALVWTGRGWCAAATINAAVLTVAPTTLMGVVPPWGLSVLLAFASAGIFFIAYRIEIRPYMRLAAGGGALATLACWYSILKSIGVESSELRPVVLTLIATAWTVGAVAEVLARRKEIASELRIDSAIVFSAASVAALAMLLHGAMVQQASVLDERVTIAVLASAVMGWLWVGLTEQRRWPLVMARAGVVITTVVAGHHFFHDAIFSRGAWQSGHALWAWAAVGWIVVAIVEAIDAVVRRLGKHSLEPRFALFADRFIWYRAEDQDWDSASRELLARLSTGMTATAALVSFGTLPVAVVRSSIEGFYTAPVLPIAVLIGGGILLAWRAFATTRSTRELMSLARVHWASAIVWASWQVSIGTVAGVNEQLIGATTIAVAVLFATDLAGPKRASAGKLQLGDVSLTLVSLLIIAAASVALLQGVWLPAVTRGTRPESLTTLSVAFWWSAGGVMTAWLGERYRSGVLGILSAVLVPATVIIGIPLINPTDWWIWIQAAAIASLAYACILRFCGSSLSLAIDISLGVGVVSGMLTAGLVTLGAVTDVTELCRLHNAAGMVLSATAVLIGCFWNRLAGKGLRFERTLGWPIGFTLLSGHLASILSKTVVTSVSAAEWLPVLWTVIAILSLVESIRTENRYRQQADAARWNTGVLAVVASTYCLVLGTQTGHFVIGLIACGAGGVLTVSVAAAAANRLLNKEAISRVTVYLTRTLSWFVLVMGGLLLARIWSPFSFGEPLVTAIVVWFAAWGLVWRSALPDQIGDREIQTRIGRMLADGEAAVFVLIALMFDACGVLNSSNKFVELHDAIRPLAFTRLVFAALLGVSVGFRFRRRGALEVATLTLLAVVASIGMRIGYRQGCDSLMLGTIAGLCVSTGVALLAFSARDLCRSINWVGRVWPGMVAGDGTAERLPRRSLARSLVRAAMVASVPVIVIPAGLLVFENSATVVPIAICGVAVLTIALVELAHQTDREWVRMSSALLALLSIGMWASCGVDGFALPSLALSTRWFVAWVVVGVAIAFAIPRLVSEAAWVRWKTTIAVAMVTTLGLAAGSLLATLGQEAVVRAGGRTEQLSQVLSLGLAGTLALLCGFCTAAGILSGPGFRYQQSWKLSDRRRALLIVAAQVFGGLTWFHLFLCKSPLADLGLRAYWPYVVMTLSFLSVGIAEWARRRNDTVLSATLKQTALFLPLIPVIGFWLSGSLVTTLFGQSDSPPWTFIQGRVSYQALLVTAAAYYGVISFLWKNASTRLLSILLGNLALWVILAQSSNWGFLSHPQAWLIPPAVCVLIAAHLHRDRLSDEAASGIRYAATLAIYITSTSDMLIQGIGTTIAGPIVLITLALIGAAAGVAFRVRPFLYLGTTFVFIGVTSMVWHAQRQIGAVWPWWVFGISAGVLLLIALMALEKNRPKLRRLAVSLQQWEA